jgi:AraC family transcriptional activator of pobA
MRQKESARDFHQRHGREYSNSGQFYVYRVEDFCNDISLPSNRRDFYKICLVTRAEGLFTYGDTVYHVKDNSVTFTNPMVPYSWEHISTGETGYFCLFTEEFINHQLKAESLAGSSLFKVNGNPVWVPDESTIRFLCGVFEKMLVEMKSVYVNKFDLLRSYIQIIIHEALKDQAPASSPRVGSSSARLSDQFLQLLESQFPIASPQHPVRLRDAHEFADQLAVHTNHLNRALKEMTGKTTTELISERLIREAKALLLHSNWNITEIGYGLGFDHAPNFNIFFKKGSGQTPNQFRKQVVAIS